MRKPKLRPIPLVIREQLEALANERDTCRSQAEKLSIQVDYLHSTKDALDAGMADQRKYLETLRRDLETMRNERDLARSELENVKLILRMKEIDLARAMGWIDAKRDCPPALDADVRTPF